MRSLRPEAPDMHLTPQNCLPHGPLCVSQQYPRPMHTLRVPRQSLEPWADSAPLMSQALAPDTYEELAHNIKLVQSLFCCVVPQLAAAHEVQSPQAWTGSLWHKLQAQQQSLPLADLPCCPPHRRAVRTAQCVQKAWHSTRAAR